jgi:hypothetical protein
MSYIPTSLRLFVEDRAHFCCEYCLLHKDDHYWSHEVDHIYATKHGGDTVEANLCLSCVDCNRHKGSDIASIDPLTKTPVFLFHPRLNHWHEHFELADGVIEGLSVQGRATARLLHFNDLERVIERQALIQLGRYPRIIGEQGS